MAQPIPGRADARANRERIVASARQVFGERGLDADIREICARSGVGMGTLYRNFPTKDDLVVAILREIASEMTAAIDAAEAVPDPAEGFLAMLRGMWSVVEDHHQLAGVLHEYAHKRELPEFAALKGRGEGIIARAQASGRLAPGLPAGILSDCVEQQATLYLALRERWDAPTVAALCERMFRGLIASAPRAAQAP